MTKFQPPRGTRDLFPQEMMKMQFIMDTARAVFERWGFDPLDTPAFEDFELLTAKSGEAIKDEIYYFRDKSDRELGLRFDFTVPLARVVASNPNLPKPFKRYQIGTVWRYDRPGAGRYREFRQADIDIVGAPGTDADAEVVACACEVLRNIGVSNFSVRVNNRKIINSFLSQTNGNPLDILRSMDKLDKIGEAGVKEELESKGVKDADSILKFIKTNEISKVSSLIKDENGRQGLKELQGLVERLERFGVPVKAGMSLVRGLEYYTGNVFEIIQSDNTSSGLTITAGGCYDDMIETFGGKPTPATGISLGVDRLANLIQLEFGKTKVNVYIANAGNTKEKCREIAKELRDFGLNAEYDLLDRPLGKQLEYVNSKGIRFAIVIGENEIKSGTIKLRDMQTGSEKEIELRNLKRAADVVNSV